MFPTRPAPAAAALLCALSLLAGCAKKQSIAPALSTTAAQILPSDPGVRGSRNGMEMMCWGVATNSRSLAELLSTHLDDTSSLDPRTRALWQSNGLRLVCIPLSSLDTIRQLLPQSGAFQRQWLGQVPLWTNVIQGTPWHNLQSVTMDNGRLSLGPGKLRILLRCWTIPLPPRADSDGVTAAMRTELLLQHQEPPRTDVANLYQNPTAPTDPLDEGLLFKRLAASITLPPDRALLIIPESPNVDWRALAQLPPEELSAPDAALAETRLVADPQPDTARVGQVVRERSPARDQTNAAASADITGPIDYSSEFARTLGELLLTPSRVRLSTDVADRPAVRSILVLVPRIPDRFTISPAAPEP